MKPFASPRGDEERGIEEGRHDTRRSIGTSPPVAGDLGKRRERSFRRVRRREKCRSRLVSHALPCGQECGAG